MAVQAIDTIPTSWLAYMAAGDCLRMIDKDDIGRSTEFHQDEDMPEDYYRAGVRAGEL